MFAQGAPADDLWNLVVYGRNRADLLKKEMKAQWSLRILGGAATAVRQWHAAQRLLSYPSAQTALVHSVLRAPPETEDAGVGQFGPLSAEQAAIDGYCQKLGLNASQADAIRAAAAAESDPPVQLIQVQARSHPIVALASRPAKYCILGCMLAAARLASLLRCGYTDLPTPARVEVLQMPARAIPIVPALQ